MLAKIDPDKIIDHFSVQIYICELWANIAQVVFFVSGFSFTTIHKSQDCREGGGYFFNSSLPLLPISQTLRHQPGNYCRELTSAHSEQPDLNWESLVFEHKSLTTKLCALTTLRAFAQVIFGGLGKQAYTKTKNAQPILVFHTIPITFMNTLEPWRVLANMSNEITTKY